MFLMNRMSNYSIDINESVCFLFPVEMLFEGFVGGIVKEIVTGYGGKAFLQQSEVSLIDEIKYGEKSLGSAYTMRHDIVVELNGKTYILDTKYKELSRFEGDDNEVRKVLTREPNQLDIYQVCEYARKRDIEDVYLLYPMYRLEEKEPIFPIGISNSPKGKINVNFIRIPFVFDEDEEKIRSQMKEIIDQLFMTAA